MNIFGPSFMLALLLPLHVRASIDFHIRTTISLLQIIAKVRKDSPDSADSGKLCANNPNSRLHDYTITWSRQIPQDPCFAVDLFSRIARIYNVLFNSFTAFQYVPKFKLKPQPWDGLLQATTFRLTLSSNGYQTQPSVMYLQQVKKQSSRNVTLCS